MLYKEVPGNPLEIPNLNSHLSFFNNSDQVCGIGASFKVHGERAVRIGEEKARESQL